MNRFSQRGNRQGKGHGKVSKVSKSEPQSIMEEVTETQKSTRQKPRGRGILCLLVF